MAHAVSDVCILPVPESKPPYDDEIGRPSLHERHTVSTGSGAVQEALALSFSLPSGAPVAPEAPAALQDTKEQTAEDKHGPAAVSPLAHRWAGRFVQALIEVLAGVRPVTQLARWTSPGVYDSVRRRASVPGGWPADRGHGTRPVVQSLRVTQPGAGATEVCAVVRSAGRARAVALRLEGADDRPLCTAVELG